jgi:hypothetical protein
MGNLRGRSRPEVPLTAPGMNRSLPEPLLLHVLRQADWTYIYFLGTEAELPERFGTANAGDNRGRRELIQV